jgi:hypothetical protein
MRFSHHLLFGISIFYLALMVLRLTSCRPVKRFAVVQPPILMLNTSCVREYIGKGAYAGARQYRDMIWYTVAHEREWDHV